MFAARAVSNGAPITAAILIIGLFVHMDIMNLRFLTNIRSSQSPRVGWEMETNFFRCQQALSISPPAG